MRIATLLWSLVCGVCAGCPSAEGTLDPWTGAGLAVRLAGVLDARGARWPVGAAPRAPRFELALSPMPAQPERRVWLATGPFDASLAADLLRTPQRASTRARLVPLRFTGERGVLSCAPLARLDAGGRYTLLVLAGPEDWWTQDVEVSRSPAAGAAWVESLPADQARAVPTNLRSLWLRFDGYLTRGSVAATLRADDRPIPFDAELMACSALGLPAGDCLGIQLPGSLPAGRMVTLSLAHLRDVTGAGLPPVSLTFHTGHGRDGDLPTLSPLACDVDERDLPFGGCVLEQDRELSLRLSTREAVLARLEVEDRVVGALVTGTGVALRVEGLEAGRPLVGFVYLTDLSGHVRTEVFAVRMARDLATLSIDEVRADPLGPEPFQEFVELLNFGGETVQVTGVWLSDQPSQLGARVVDGSSLAPGERGLVVGPGFDADENSDGPLPPGVRLLRTDRALSLSNRGEAVYLRDGQGRRLSAAPRLRPERPGACIARHAEDPRAGAPASFGQDPQAACTPGRETRWP